MFFKSIQNNTYNPSFHGARFSRKKIGNTPKIEINELIENKTLNKISEETGMLKAKIVEIVNTHFKDGKPKNGSVAAIFNQKRRAEVLEQNISDKEAAEILKTSEKRVAKLRKILGIEKPKTKIAREEKLNLVKSEIENGLTESEIVKKHKLPSSVVKYFVKQINENLSS